MSMLRLLPFYILLGLTVVIGIGYLLSSADTPTTPSKPDTVTPAPTSPSTATTSTQPEDTNDVTIPPVGIYEPYDAETFAQRNADTAVLFFHATWCPSCRALDQDITAQQATIPPDVAIYRVDYDTATELKQRYGITTQHSVITIGANGEAVSDITHPLTLEQLLRNL